MDRDTNRSWFELGVRGGEDLSSIVLRRLGRCMGCVVGLVCVLLWCVLVLVARVLGCSLAVGVLNFQRWGNLAYFVV